MLQTLSVIDQLIEVYKNEEWWIKDKIEDSEIRKYYEKLIDQGNILIYEVEGELLGYIEFWRINFEQFGRIICNDEFSAYIEDINSGNIGYVANVWIKKSHRRSGIMKLLALGFCRKNILCDYFVGRARRKKCEPVKVFNRMDFMNKYVKDNNEEDIGG